MLKELEEKEVARAKAAGDKIVSYFSGAIRCPDVTRWNVGDVFTFPEKYKIYRHTFEGGKSFAEYIFVEVKTADGKELTKKFFPSQFTKLRFEVTDEGLPTGKRYQTDGTAAVWYKEQTNTDEAMQALRGKTIVVSNITTIKAMNFNRTYVVDTNILTLDFVETKEENARRRREAIDRERELAQQRREEEARRRREAIERERKYQEALVKYNAELARYESEMKIYTKAMSLKKRFTYGGQFPNGAWFICFLLMLVLIFFSMFLSMLENIVPYGMFVLLDIALLVGGYRLIFKKLKPYLEEEHFDENGFQQWERQNSGSPLIKYVRNNWAPSKPIPPTY